MLRARAPAKVNLFLHVLGRRPDGYHTLQSLVVFTEFGDEVAVEPGDALTLSVNGPMAQAIASVPAEENLAIRAARLLREKAGRPSLGAHIHLTKLIPAGAGLGGASSDAAAVLRLLGRLWSFPISQDLIGETASRLGADVPVCLSAASAIVEGIGERLRTAAAPRSEAVVLAFTGQPLATASVFRSLQQDEWSQGDIASSIKLGNSGAELDDILARASNDLMPAALRLQPDIAVLLSDLRNQPGCCLARMSGSGAACFGLFASEIEAGEAVARLGDIGWWAVATRFAESGRLQ